VPRGGLDVVGSRSQATSFYGHSAKNRVTPGHVTKGPRTNALRGGRHFEIIRENIWRFRLLHSPPTLNPHLHETWGASIIPRRLRSNVAAGTARAVVIVGETESTPEAWVSVPESTIGGDSCSYRGHLVADRDGAPSWNAPTPWRHDDQKPPDRASRTTPGNLDEARRWTGGPGYTKSRARGRGEKTGYLVIDGATGPS